MLDKFRVVCYAHGNIVNGDNGVRYDKNPVKVVAVQANVSYEPLLNGVCRALRINTKTHRVELIHRCPVAESDRIYYFAIPINDDDDVKAMLLSAQHGVVGAAVQVFVQIHKISFSPLVYVSRPRSDYDIRVVTRTHKSQAVSMTQKASSSSIKRRNINIESLSNELMMNILSRIPTIDLANMRFVCRRWRNIVKMKDPQFRMLHLSHFMTQPPDNQFLLLKRDKDLCLVDLTSRREITIETPYAPSFFSYDIIGSCNGLLCLGRKDRSEILIINPFTRQHVLLPMEFPFFVSWGFGFDSANKIFKVVVIVRDVFDIGFELKICDLYSHKYLEWRCKEWNGTFNFNYASETLACFFNGRLHWTHKKAGSVNIFSFDLADEEFRMVPIPDCLRSTRKFDLFVSRGCLCIIRSQASATPIVEIWAMKEYGVKESWVKEFETKPLMLSNYPPHFDMSNNGTWRLTLKGLGSVRDGGVLLKCKRRECGEAILFSSDPTCDQFQLLKLKSVVFENGSVIHTASLNWI